VTSELIKVFTAQSASYVYFLAVDIYISLFIKKW